ncbi:MAG: hypothetical protein IIA67_04760 [Planctomycetes bacterium]|nr:hypothetical protein [Planctomycetota bacterium]
MRLALLTAAALTLTLLTGGPLLAEGPDHDQLRAEAKKLFVHGKELFGAGKKDQAEKYFAEAKKLIAKADDIAKHRKGDRRREGELRGEQREAQRREIVGRLEQIGRQLGELKKAGKLDQAEALLREGGKLKKRLKLLAGGGEKHRHGKHEEFERYVAGMKKHIGQLAREGKREQAEKLEHQLRQKIEAYKKQHADGKERGHDERRRVEANKFEHYVNDLRKKIEHLVRQGKRDVAEELERVLADKIEAYRHEHAKHKGGHEHPREKGEHRQHGNEIERKIHHLRVAADNLEAAGQHDLARDVRQEAERTEREARQHEGRRHAEELERRVHELEREVERLRAELEKARAKRER